MGTIDAFQRLVWSPQFKQNCFPHRSKMGVLKSFLRVILWKSPENLNTLFFDKRMFAVLTNLRKSASSKHPRRSGTPPRIRSSLEGGAFEVPPTPVRTAFFHPFFFSMRSIGTIQSDAEKVTTSCGLTTPQPQHLVFCTDFTPEK